MHTIRLRAAWTVESLAPAEPTASEQPRDRDRRTNEPGERADVGKAHASLPSGRIELPIRLRAPREASARNPVRLIRSFHSPTGLGDSTQVRLAIEGLTPGSKLWLNDRPIDDASLHESRGRVDIRNRLSVRNRLVIETDLAESPSGSSSPVPSPGHAQYPNSNRADHATNVSADGGDTVLDVWLEIIEDGASEAAKRGENAGES